MGTTLDVILDGRVTAPNLQLFDRDHLQSLASREIPHLSLLFDSQRTSEASFCSVLFPPPRSTRSCPILHNYLRLAFQALILPRLFIMDITGFALFCTVKS
jgi:hypothetical protein